MFAASFKHMEPTTTAPTPKLYHPIVTIIITIGLYVGAQVLAGVIVSLIPSLLKWGPDRGSQWLSNTALAQFLFIAFAEAITLFVLYLFLKRRKASFRTLGLDTFKPGYIVKALGGFAVYFMLYIGAIILATKLFPSINTEQKQELGFNMSAHGLDLVFIFISLVILPPITEEIVVRGFLFRGLRTKWPLLLSAVITSLLFGAAHLGIGGKNDLLWTAGIDTFMLSMVLCYIREKTKSLWPGIIIHMIKNGLAFALLFNIVKYFK